MEEKNKLVNNKERNQSKISRIVLIIAFFLIGIGVGLLLSNVLDSNKAEKDNNNEEKVQTIHDLKDGEIDINNEEVKEYFDMYKPIKYDDDIMLNQLTSDIYKVQLSSRLVNDKDYVEVPCNSIDSSIGEENSYCGDVYKKSNWKNSSNTTKSVKKETINDYYKYYFGSNEEIPNVNFSKDTVMFTYDSGLNSYVGIMYDGGGTGPDIVATLEKATKSGNDLIITTTEKRDIPNRDISSKVTLTLTWEEKTNHYIFKNRHVD